MAESSSAVHEEGLSPKVLDRHRAIVSLMEELEAVDWYAQRAEAASDPELRAILEHNGDEEKEHAMMVLEWLRRTDPGFDEYMRTYLFSSGSITEAESAEKSSDGSSAGAAASSSDGSLGIGSLKAT
jgi:ferritin-like protein